MAVHRDTRRRVAVAAVLVVPALAAACGSTPLAARGSPSTAVVSLQGIVASTGPVAEAHVTVVAAGRTVASATTTDAGFFTVSVPKEPLTVTASGGTVGGQAFASTMDADVASAQLSAPVAVTPVTTLVATYRAAHRTVSDAQAVARTRGFLAVPASVGLGMGLVGTQPFFDAATFMGDATADGGLGAYVSSLAATMGTAGATHPFPAAAANEVINGCDLDAHPVSCPFADLQGADLAGRDLTGAILEGANLEKANLSGAGLDEANLIQANLSGANLEGAELWQVDARESILQGADLSGASLMRANIEYSRLAGVLCSHCNLMGAQLKDDRLAGADFTSATLSHTELSRADLQHADLRYADLQYANLAGATLKNADLRDADLRHVDLATVANLQGANLDGAKR